MSAINTYYSVLIYYTVPSISCEKVKELIFFCSYVLFTVIHYASGGTNEDGDRYIYNVLDWSKPGKKKIPVNNLLWYKIHLSFSVGTAVLWSILGLAGGIVAHFINCGLHQLRVFIHGKTSSNVVEPVGNEEVFSIS